MDASRTARKVGDFRDLRIWQLAMDLVIESYRCGDLLPDREKFGLVAQIRRAATSVPANIAEGNGRVHRREYLHHLSIARGSVNELLTLAAITARLGYVPAAELTALAKTCESVSRMLTRLRRSLAP